MSANQNIANILGTPLSPDWTIEGLAERLLDALAGQRPEEAQDLILDPEATTDRQSRRLLRPLLACLAVKAAAECGTSVNLYGGHMSFKRPGPDGPVWIMGRFENRPGQVRATLRRSNMPPEVPAANGDVIGVVPGVQPTSDG